MTRDQPIVGRTGYYQDRFLRLHTGNPPEPTPGLRGWVYDLLGAVCGLVALGCVWFLLAVLV